MKNWQLWLGATAVLLAGTFPVTGQAKTKAKPTVIILENTVTNSPAKATTELVTNGLVAAHPVINDEPDATQTVMVPKNSVLTDSQKSGNGMTFKLSGQNHTLYADDLASQVYSTKTLHLGKSGYQKLKKAGQTWSHSLSKAQINAVGNYTSEGYEDMNTALRTDPKKAPKDVQRQVNLVKNGLYTFNLAKPMTVWRGTSWEGLKLSLGKKPIKVGAVYRDGAFSSTSISRDISSGFSGKVMLKINVPAGYHGAYIDSISSNKGEREFLLNPGTRMIVTKLQKVNMRAVSRYAIYKGGHYHQKTHRYQHSYWVVSMSLEK